MRKRMFVLLAAQAVWLMQQGTATYGGSLSTFVIADVLTRPDGQRFSGLVSITPFGFGAESTPPSIVVPVKQQGMFEVQLPATPRSAYYSVHFQTDEKTSWDERWIVPHDDSKLLRLTDIRETASRNKENSEKGVDRAAVSTISFPISVNDVTGLSDQLSSLTNTVAAINASNSTLTLLVNALNTSATTSQVRGELPSGNINGTNGVFSLALNPAAGSVVVYRNGVRLAVNIDYTISGNTIVFLSGAIPQRGDALLADYVKAAN